jgi:hypothetical protein
MYTHASRETEHPVRWLARAPVAKVWIGHALSHGMRHFACQIIAMATDRAAQAAGEPAQPQNNNEPPQKWARATVGRRVARATKREVQRAVEAVRAAGLQLAAVRIEADGTIVVVPGAPANVESRNPWDGSEDDQG